jgi:hypothetical protein
LLFVGGELFVCLIAYRSRIGALAEIIKKNWSRKDWKIIWLPCQKNLNYCGKMPNTRKLCMFHQHALIMSMFLVPTISHISLVIQHISPMLTCNQCCDLHSNKARVPNLTFSIKWNKSSHSQAFLP